MNHPVFGLPLSKSPTAPRPTHVPLAPAARPFAPLHTCSLTFKQPDHAKYPSMKLAYSAGRTGGTMTGVLSAANEQAVQMFIDHQIGYLDLMKLNEAACEAHMAELVAAPSLEEIVHYDAWVRERARGRQQAPEACAQEVANQHHTTLLLLLLLLWWWWCNTPRPVYL